MKNKTDLVKPTQTPRIIDLLNETGVNTDKWGDFKAGKGKAASNPKYCYDWSFEDTDSGVMVLCLWYEGIIEKEGVYLQILNMLKVSKINDNKQKRIKAAKAHELMFKSFKTNKPLRVILNTLLPSHLLTNSSVEYRILDTRNWYVANYNYDSGSFVLIRD